MSAFIGKKLLRIYDKLYSFYGPQHWWPADTPLEVIVGAILTQNTSWSNVEKAIEFLKEEGLLKSFRKILHIDEKDLSALIRPSGYHNIKSRRLKNFLHFVHKKYGSDLKRMARRKTEALREELLAINGIGPETCDSILLYAFNKPVFVVDAYTRRILSRHNILDEKCGYDDVQRLFMSNLPGNTALYNEYHALIVRTAKDFCRKMRCCAGCPLENV